MPNDFLTDLGLLGVTARIKRLSDNLSSSIKSLYLAEGIDLEPSWHLILLLLDQRGPTAPSEIGAALGLSLPAVTNMVKRMQRRGYVDVMANQSDGRRREVQLTALAEERFQEFRAVWEAGQESIRELLQGDEAFLTELAKVEGALAQRSFDARASRHLAGAGHA